VSSDTKKPWGGRFEHSPGRRSSTRVRRLAPCRQAHVGRGHPRLDRARSHARSAGRDQYGVRRRGDRGGALRDLPRDPRRQLRVPDRRRGHPHGDRAGADRAHRPGGGAPAHRSQPQRPGRHSIPGCTPRRAANSSRATVVCVPRSFAWPKKHVDTVMPGYTHLQKAQPVLFAHHLLAYFWMLTRDSRGSMPVRGGRCDAARIGRARGYDLPHRSRYRRRRARVLLGQPELHGQRVSDRDFLLDITYASAVTMVHLSRLCEELILWSAEEFGFVTMDDEYATGLEHHAAEEEPRLRRAHPRQDRPGRRRPRRDC
jgi:hypothetical protein